MGLVAIIGSLIFVGLELRQSQQIAIAAQYQERTNAGREYFYASLARNHRIEDLADDIEAWEWPEGFLSEEGWLALRSRLFAFGRKPPPG